MSATATRMLLLGAVAMFEPVNGYQVRRELVSWQVDRWAHVNPGSIYHGLASLTGQGLLRRTDLVDGSREVAVYETTPEGRGVLDHQLVRALEEVDPYDRVAFHVAFGMLPLVAHDRVLQSLTRRRVALEGEVDRLSREQDRPGKGPPHARRGRVLWLDMAVAELAWLREVIHDVEDGTLRLEPHEDWGWTMPAEDPAHPTAADRDRYRALLGRTP